MSTSKCHAIRYFSSLVLVVKATSISGFSCQKLMKSLITSFSNFDGCHSADVAGLTNLDLALRCGGNSLPVNCGVLIPLDEDRIVLESDASFTRLSLSHKLF